MRIFLTTLKILLATKKKKFFLPKNGKITRKGEKAKRKKQNWLSETRSRWVHDLLKCTCSGCERRYAPIYTITKVHSTVLSLVVWNSIYIYSTVNSSFFIFFFCFRTTVTIFEHASHVNRRKTLFRHLRENNWHFMFRNKTDGKRNIHISVLSRSAVIYSKFSFSMCTGLKTLRSPIEKYFKTYFNLIRIFGERASSFDKEKFRFAKLLKLIKKRKRL